MQWRYADTGADTGGKQSAHVHVAHGHGTKRHNETNTKVHTHKATIRKPSRHEWHQHLLLSTGKPHATLANFGVIALLKCRNEVVCVGLLRVETRKGGGRER